MNTAEYIVKKMEELGVNHFFGVPGDYNFNILNSVQNSHNNNWINCTNELNAGYAADGYARIKGFGALVTTFGVGELSAINAIAGSMAENVPVLHIVGMPSTKNIENKDLIHHNLQNADYFSFLETYKNVTAANSYLTFDNAKSEIDRVLKVLVKERKPVYLALPADVSLMEISDEYINYEWESDKETLSTVVQKILQKINSSNNPLILGDVLIKRFDAEIEYKEFVEKSNFPVTNFIMGTNLINVNTENYIGGYYGEYKNSIAKKQLEDTDCLIAIGAINSDLNSFGLNFGFDINNHIGIYGTYTYIEGEKYENVKMADVISAITKEVQTKEIKTEKPYIGYKPSVVSQDKISSNYIYPRLQEFIKANDIVFAETGCVPHGVCQMKFDENVDIQFQSLWASIGWATPAALGGMLAKPNARIILITGDGAHQMTAMEIGTMLKLGLKPVIILLNNKGYTIERFLSGDFDNSFNDVVQMNYTKFARSFEGDVWAIKTNTDDDFDKALKVTQIMNKMCYIEVCTEKSDCPKLVKDFVCKDAQTSFENVEDNEEKDNESQQPEKMKETVQGNEHVEIIEVNFAVQENEFHKIDEKNAEQNNLTEETKESDLTGYTGAGNFKYETVVHTNFKEEIE